MKIRHFYSLISSTIHGKVKILLPICLFIISIIYLEYSIRHSQAFQKYLISNASMSSYSYEKIILQGLMYNPEKCSVILFGSSTFLNSLPIQILNDEKYIKLFVMTGSPAYFNTISNLFPEKIKECPLIIGLSPIDLLHNYIGEKTLNSFDPSDILFSLSTKELIYRSGALVSGWLGQYSKLWSLKTLVFSSLRNYLLPDKMMPAIDHYAIGIVDEYDINSQPGMKKWGVIQNQQSIALDTIGKESKIRIKKTKIYLINSRSTFNSKISKEVGTKLLELQKNLALNFDLINLPQLSDEFFLDEVHFSNEGRKLLTPFWQKQSLQW